MTTITDPDSLTDSVDVVISVAAKTIRVVAGTAITDAGSTGGVTGQALYSFLKDMWKASSTYIKYPFPMEAITPEQFEFVQGWKPYDSASRKLIRTAGLAERSAAGTVTRMDACIVTLGDLGSSDQVYYRFGTGSAANLSYTGPANEPIQIYGDTDNGNFDYRASALQLFCREQGKTFGSSSSSAIGASTLNYIAYRFPLSNATDLNIVASDATIAADAPYTGITVTFYGTNQMFDVDGDSETEPYTILITDAAGTATTQEIYEKIQYALRQNSDIDAGAGSVIGKTASALLSFVGQTLVGATGVRIVNLNANYYNSVEFYDQNGVKRTFPFVAAGTLTFNSNLQADTTSKYWLFFKTLTGSSNDFGESGATIVNDADGNPITGDIDSAASISFSFAYDSNVQGGRTAGTNAEVIAVALGTDTAQYTTAEATITRATGINIGLQSALERNYVE